MPRSEGPVPGEWARSGPDVVARRDDSMTVTLYCPNLRCRATLEVPERARGRRVRCSRCGTNFLVPTKEDSQNRQAKSAAPCEQPADPS